METLKKNKTTVILITYTVLLAAFMFNFEKINGWISHFFFILSPIIYGLVFAFLVGLIARGVKYLYYKVFRTQKYSEAWSITIGYLIFLSIIVGFFLLVIPALNRSLIDITNNFPNYWSTMQKFIMNIAQRLEIGSLQWEAINTYLNEIYLKSYNFLTSKLPDILGYAFNIMTFLKDLSFGFVISVYILLTKKSLKIQIRKTITVLLSEDHAKKAIITAKQAKKIFTKYISGQVIVSIVLGIVCYIGMILFKMPYAELISLIIGMSNLVPIIGPIIGSIITTIIILLISPMDALWFLVLVIVLQQLENNILAPKIIGDSIGISGLWVMVAIIFGGAFFGLGGMIIAVPTMGVIYHLISEYINNRYNSSKYDDFINNN